MADEKTTYLKSLKLFDADEAINPIQPGEGANSNILNDLTNEATGDFSHAKGQGTKATGDHQHVQGKYNKEDTKGEYAHIVGWGTGDAAANRKNIHTLSTTGEAWFAGNVIIGDNNLDLSKAGTITLGEEIKVTQQNGASIGGYANNTTISADTSIATILKTLLQKYISPTLSFTTNSTSYEYGTIISPTITATYKNNSAYKLTEIAITDNNGNELEMSQTDSSISYTLTENKITNNIIYKAYAKYKDSPSGAVNKLEKTLQFTPYRNGYFYGVLATDNSVPLTSDIIRGGTRKNGAYAAGDLPLISASSVDNRKRIFVACPAKNAGIKKVIMPSASNADCTTDFVKQSSTISVEGANKSASIDYNVWVYEPAYISDDQTFTVTLG